MAVAEPPPVFPGTPNSQPSATRKRHTNPRKPPKLPETIRPRWETPEPPGVVGTYGDRAIAWSKRELGITLGPWQQYVVRQILRFDKLGDLLARIALISTARQNGKSLIVRTIVGWILDEGQHEPAFAGWTAILAAAHDSKQARLMYRAVGADIDGNDRLRKQSRTSIYRGITVGHIDFDIVTNQPGSARGWSAGLVAFDEVLTQRDFEMYESLGPTQSAQRSPLMLLTSTAGHPDSTLLRAFYDRLVRQAAGDEAPDPSFYGAWWASDERDVGYAGDDRRALTEADWAQIERANPALPDGRLSRASIIHEHSIFPPASWRRERLNLYEDEAAAEGDIAPGVWAPNRIGIIGAPLDGLTGPYALGVEVQPGWERASITVSGVREDGRIGTEVYRDLRRDAGTSVTADRLVKEIEAFPDIDDVVVIAYDGVSGAAPRFARHHEETGFPWDPLKPAAMVAACMDAMEMILAGTLAVDDPLIDAQVKFVKKRPVGQDGAFRFARQASLGPIDAFMAMVLSAHAIAYLGGGPLIG